jgi:hypothetical protein
MAKKNLQPEVAAKYTATENFLYGQKLVFPKQSVHSIGGKPLHELTLAEADTLVSLGCLKGVLTLKAPVVPVQKPAPVKPEVKEEEKSTKK